MTMNDNNANLGALISVVHKHGLYLEGAGHRIYSGSRRDSDSREHQHINLQGAPRGFFDRYASADVSRWTLSEWVGKIPLPCTVTSVAVGAPGLAKWDCGVWISSPSHGLIVPRRMVSSGGGGAGWPLVRALWAGAQVLLLRASAGGDSGGGGGGRASLLLKVCDDDSHIAHRYSELLSRAPVHVLQLRSEV